MKLKPVKRNLPPPPPVEEKPKKQRKSGKNTLPPDNYQPIVGPFRFLVSDRPSHKDPDSRVKHYLEVSIKRSPDELGLPMCYVSTYQESDFYTGYLKGKSITLPVTEIASLVEYLESVEEQADKLGLLQE